MIAPTGTAPNAATAATGSRDRTPTARRRRPRLLWHELRQNPDLWLLIAAGAIGVWMAHLTTLSDPILFWTETSQFVRKAAFVIGPVAAAVGARAAARDRWCGLEELVSTVARPEASRRLTSWAAVTIASAGVHLLLAVYVVARTAAVVVWDGPYYATMLDGPSVVVATSAFGFAVGSAWPNRFVAPVATVGAFFLLLQGSNRAEAGWSSFLSPLHDLERSPWTGLTPDLGPLPALFWLAIAGIFLGTLALRRSRSVSPALLGVSAVLAIIVANAVAAQVPENALTAPSPSTGPNQADPNAPAAGTYAPVCGDGEIPVCVHPAHSPVLDTASDQINRALAPLVALPGADTIPRRVDLLPRPDPAPGPGVVSRSIGDGSPAFQLWMAVLDTTGIAVGAPPLAAPLANPQTPMSPAQSVVRTHLLQQSGASVSCAADRLEASGRNWGVSGFGSPVSCAALDRFNALSSVERDTWLAANLPALRAGQLTLQDLP